MPPKPHIISKEWVVPGHPHIRVQLKERPDINIYTSLEVLEGTWTLVENSARGHGLDFVKAEARVDLLLSDGVGGWRSWTRGRPGYGP